MKIDLTDAVVEQFSRVHWNTQRGADNLVSVATTSSSRPYEWRGEPVLWDDEDMRETDRELWRQKTLAAFHAIHSPEAREE